MDLQQAQREPPRNFRKVNWEKFEESLCHALEATFSGTFMDIPVTPTALDNYILKLTDYLQQAIQQHVPHSRPSNFTKNTSLHQHFLDRRNHTRNTYNKAVRKAKLSHWKDWLENINERDIWTACKYAKNPLLYGSRTLIPTLHKKDLSGLPIATFDTAPSKATALAELFSPHAQMLSLLHSKTTFLTRHLYTFRCPGSIKLYTE
ncbi:hypothetical protein M422DRAFT_262767 [Sphaerobolus stellatus SS14]|uniref:Uncharacterized protein n=1 Tax=Sphaerobolus stellatus (strain SS14) TaxID=990650 RepID=A0A0C9UJI4_SPHS4|nr:hypothetical protein M422DRAFT_262767 [Sphaerobolus stellatus SS14]